MRFSTLEAWLVWQESLHPNRVELGLNRVGVVARQLNLERPANTVIAVSGTNGKGSCVSLLESILCQANHRVGSYTSPHLFCYNERVRIQGRMVTDHELCKAFAQVDAAREDTTLSYFEFGTLAALQIFANNDLDVVILEVGLGGRLDAVNIIDTDVAVITNVGLDHTEWLGSDRESIGREKSGIMRSGKPTVYGGPNPPQAVKQQARQLGAPLHRLNVDYRYRITDNGHWDWESVADIRTHLPLPNLSGEVQVRNAACVLMVLKVLASELPVTEADIRSGLQNVSLPGRFQVLPGQVQTILDVAHNLDSALVLCENLRRLPNAGCTHAVFSILSDKDTQGIITCLMPQVNSWYLAEVGSKRALPIVELEELVRTTVDGQQVMISNSVAHAYKSAHRQARTGDRVVVFGSFYTVAEVLALTV